MGLDSPSHWLVLAIVVVALFGYKKLPDASRSLGRSLRIFKTEIKGMTEDDKSRENVTAERPTVIDTPAGQAPAEPAPPAAPTASDAAPTTSD